MGEDDRLYYHRRAEAELKLAMKATCSKAVAAHHVLAERYLERIDDALADLKDRGDDAR